MSKPDSSYLETGEKSTTDKKQLSRASQSGEKDKQAPIQELTAPDTDTSENELAIAPEVVETIEAEAVENEPVQSVEAEAGTNVPASLPPNIGTVPTSVVPLFYAGQPIPPAWRFPRREENDLGRILLVTLAIALVIGLIAVGIVNKIGTQNATESYFFQSQPRQKIIISNDIGAIHIHGQLMGPFGFQVNKYSEGIGLGLINTEVTYNQDGAKTTVNARIQPDFLFAGSRGVDIDVAVPQTADVEAYTATGNITVTGPVGQISARTNTGSLDVENSTGRIMLQADTGSIVAHNFKGHLMLATRQGDIETRQVQLSNQSSVEVGSGAITFNGSLDRNGSYHFTTTNGPISLTLPADAAFHLSIEDTSGPVKNEFGHLSYGRAPQAQVIIRTQRDAVSVYKLK
ncbi:hypothetical protein KDA_13680 [Dictyobacter alpinus]|uniref:DUF4097 domain-containing protein n=1 Tax=Dictyobacter alpinus TaxID=2014873 RepID=A0A402B3F5_9CHLR|nr:DUF4097 family beta strand repeat-containing protein [Dictyobacter alpinus]GCE25884.1 hypothetical protein KDA_13680 [Dictyobacter alpinus]